MKQIVACLTIFCLVALLPAARAQQGIEVPPDQPVAMNGIEYGYTIRNESKKDVGGKGVFSRYEVTLYVTNHSGCSKLMLPRQTFTGLQYQDLLAEFDCLNATGMRLTSKSGTLRANEFYVPYSTSTKGPDGKMVTTSVQVRVGNIVRNGETVTSNVIFIVPEGERPALRVRMQELADL